MSLLSFECRHRFRGGFELNIEFEASHLVTSLFGPSGSGKTSVLSMIAGFARPQSGRIQLGERTLTDTTAKIDIPAQKRHVGFVFQDHLLFPHMKVNANLRYGQRHRQGNGRPIQFDRVIEVLELGQLLDRYPRNLSGGERQRVALGRALLSGPELLLMDEPLAALDDALKVRILAYLERIVSEWQIPTLFVSHGQAEVRRLASWVVVLEKGRVIARGKPEEALGQPQPLGWKNSVGPVNLLRIEQAQVQDGHLECRVGDQILSLPPTDDLPPPPLFVQFSPDDVTLSRQDISGVSARNQLHGLVRQLVKLPDGVFVAVDVGQILWSEVTPDAVDDLQLRPGAQVTCLVKSHSLRLLE